MTLITTARHRRRAGLIASFWAEFNRDASFASSLDDPGKFQR
jgi:hypothetical protein